MAADRNPGEAVKVIAVEPVKAGGKWHKPGDELSLPKSVAEDLGAAVTSSLSKRGNKAPPPPPPAPAPAPAAPAPAAPPAPSAPATPAPDGGQSDLVGDPQP